MPENVLKSASITRNHEFALRPDASAHKALAESLGITAVRKLSFAGQILPDGSDDLLLQATLGVTVVQPCGVTGDPVTTRIDEPVVRRYVAGFEDPEADEAEMPDDDSTEALPAEIDLIAVMTEAVALALPPWPRAEGIEPVDLSVTEPGKVPMTAEDARPFAGLKTLRDQLKDGEGSDQ